MYARPVLPVLAQAVDVERRCGEVRAVSDVSCVLRGGEIHAVCGENGAGKSTLLKLFAGMMVPDRGRVEVMGSALSPGTPREAIRRGVSIVLQHFALIPSFSVLENVMLGHEPAGALGVLDVDEARRRTRKVFDDLGVAIALDAPVSTLGIGDKQRVEIARALYRDARLVMLDEPTAVLTKAEADALYRTLRRLSEQGKGIVVVTHKMDEVRAHADWVTVLRRGKRVLSMALDGDRRAQAEQVTRAVMGDAPGERTTVVSAVDPAARTVLALQDVTLGRALRGLSLEVRAGEIVGVAGVEGNGQRELVAVLAGDVSVDAGTVVGAPFAVVREDRQHQGLVLDASLEENLLLGELGAVARWGVIDREASDRETDQRLRASGVDAKKDRLARSLSGGNQQKIVMARALARMKQGRARALVAAQPTRGVDIAASVDIHRRLREVAEQGGGVLVVSSDLDELRALCHRLVVLNRGRIVADLPPTVEDGVIGRHMLGVAGTAEGGAP